MDRDIRDPMDLLDEIENVLDIVAAPINWPIRMGKQFKGVYDLYSDKIYVFKQGVNFINSDSIEISGLFSDEAKTLLGLYYDDFVDELS